MRIVNGPIIMTREERMKIVHEIKERILDKYGDDVKAIGVYGSLGRQTDGPYSDIEMMCVMSTEEAEFSHEWTTGEWKVEVNFDSEEILLDYASQVESDWPLTHGQFFSILPIYDSGGYLEKVYQTAKSVEAQTFHDAICALIVEELFEYAGKWRNIRVQGPTTFLPSLTVQVAMAGAMLIGLHHRICYTTSASVLTEAVKQSDLPSGYDHLCQFVMSGQLSDSEKLLESLENFWNGIQEWTERHGYIVDMSKRIPF
ncbi:TPA: aminoglycoside O-nucleotidyltransferase ANT(4')-Ia [Staphylococcus aureus]|nr:aminoglycoside O-nucleotidyltransferase ANT(4')-Ia [Staphylococcus aureus]HCV6541524.1 aminoglycoside O-nucleotidyltransferase ANT(4')-Ia [Staphylococcus aureus]